LDFIDARRSILDAGNASKDDVVRFLEELGRPIPLNRRGRADNGITDAMLLGL
jgi:hypothetical protein